MRIHFLLTQDLESPAGTGRYFPWAKALVKRGHSVTISALHADYAQIKAKNFCKSGVEIRYVAQMHVLKRGNQKFYFSTPKLIWLAFRATLSLTYSALSIPADIIHVGKPQPMNGIAGWIAKTLRKRILFVDCDDLEIANNRFGKGWQQRVVNFFERNLPKIAEQVTTHTHILEAQLLNWGIPGEKITYLPHGIDRDRFLLLPSTHNGELPQKYGIVGKKIIVYVGSMSLGSHAIDLLLEAFARIHTKHPDTVLMLVGGGEDYEFLQNKTNLIGLSRVVIFCGKVPSADAPAYYRLGNVSVDPVPNNASGQASLSMKIFETWAAEIPLVTVDVGDRREILGKPLAGLIVPPDSPDDLANAIQQIIDQPELAQTLVQRGKERVSNYMWDRLVEKIEKVYENVLIQKAGH